LTVGIPKVAYMDSETTVQRILIECLHYIVFRGVTEVP